MSKPLGKQLKEVRIARGLSQERAALLIGVTRNTITRIEVYGATPSDLTLAKIEKFLNYQPDVA